jgi:hypothetical protein
MESNNYRGGLLSDISILNKNKKIKLFFTGDVRGFFNKRLRDTEATPANVCGCQK